MTLDAKVRTRFAPSPTGMLHIGGVRTALYNYLFAKHHGGEFLLRIEDTDHDRSSQEAVDVILQGMDWLGLKADGPVVYQASRAARHAEVAKHLLTVGQAYCCYCTPEELKAGREHAIANKLPPRYDRRCRDRAPYQNAHYAIRLKAPLDGETVVNDLVQGTVTVKNSELDDMVLLRNDGTPTYMLAVVVDDHDMGISHVIRGDDHLTNTFRQVQIYNAMKWDLPEFAHIPLIHAPTGEKLAKRHGAVSIMEFQKQGFIPEGLCNYLLRLGWGHGDTEIISREDAIKIFDIKDVGRSAARLDYTKMVHANGVWIRQSDDGWLTEQVIAMCRDMDGIDVDELTASRIKFLMPQLKERAKTIVELVANSLFLNTSFGGLLPAAFITQDNLDLLNVIYMWMNSEFSNGDFDEKAKTFIHTVADGTGIKLGDIAKPLRMVLTHNKNSPPMDAVMLTLGKDAIYKRMDGTMALMGQVLAKEV